MFGFGKKKVYKVKWLEPKYNKWLVKYTTYEEAVAYKMARELEEQGMRIRIFMDTEPAPIYSSKSSRPISL